MLIDTATLETLPDRELASGLSEVVKYGLIRDAALFEWLEQNMQRLLARDAAVRRRQFLAPLTLRPDMWPLPCTAAEVGVRPQGKWRTAWLAPHPRLKGEQHLQTQEPWVLPLMRCGI